MRLVNSFMTIEEMNNEDVNLIIQIIKDKYPNNLEVQKYKFEKRKYFETDFDLIDFNFIQEKIYEEIDGLISMYEEIKKSISCEIDIIVANDDTETEILKYEKDMNNVESFGLFVTSRVIPNIKPYYSSNICNVYLNFKFVSFGVIFE